MYSNKPIKFELSKLKNEIKSKVIKVELVGVFILVHLAKAHLEHWSSL